MIGEILRKLIAKPLAASKNTWNTVAAATASCCESLLLACKSTLASDFHRIKEAHIKRLEAGADSQDADARRKLASAAQAANKVTSRSHQDALDQFERERLALENKKKAADVEIAAAKADKAKAEAARAKFRAVVESIKEARKLKMDEKEQLLFDALRRLQQEGGTLFVDQEQLKKLLKPPTDTGGDEQL